MSRDEADKKAKEREHAESMVKLLGIEAAIEDGDPPDYRPDMRLVFPGGRRVGLEHTLAVVQGIADGHMPTECLKDELSGALTVAKLNATVLVTIPQTLGVTLANRKVRTREVEVVVSLVRDALKIGGVVSFADLRDIEDDDGNVVWPDPRRRSTKHTYLHINDRDLRAARAVYVQPNNEPVVMLCLPGDVHRSGLIQASINDKAKKLDAYRLKCPEVWLLVVGSSGIVGTSLDLSAAQEEFISLARGDIDTPHVASVGRDPYGSRPLPG